MNTKIKQAAISFLAGLNEILIDNNAFSGTLYSTVVKITVTENGSKYAFVNGLLIKKEGSEQIVMMQNADVEKIEVPEGVTEVAIRLGGEKCREISLPLTLKAQRGTFTVNGGTITFQNPTVPAFRDEFTITNDSKNVTTVIVPKGSLASYETTMNNIVMKRIDAELFQEGYIAIREQ